MAPYPAPVPLPATPPLHGTQKRHTARPDSGHPTLEHNQLLRGGKSRTIRVAQVQSRTRGNPPPAANPEGGKATHCRIDSATLHKEMKFFFPLEQRS